MDTFNGRTYYDNLAEYLRMELARLEVSPLWSRLAEEKRDEIKVMFERNISESETSEIKRLMADVVRLRAEVQRLRAAANPPGVE